MTRAANAVLLYLDRYLENNPKRRRALLALYKKTTGTELSKTQIWKHTKRKAQPNLSATLVYLVFLSLEKAIKASPVPGELFDYKNPAWLKK